MLDIIREIPDRPNDGFGIAPRFRVRRSDEMKFRRARNVRSDISRHAYPRRKPTPSVIKWAIMLDPKSRR